MNGRREAFKISRGLLEFLVRYYPYIPEHQIVLRTGLSKNQVRICARRLGLRKHPDYLSTIRSGRHMIPFENVPVLEEKPEKRPERERKKKTPTCMEAYCKGKLSRMHEAAIIKTKKTK